MNLSKWIKAAAFGGVLAFTASAQANLVGLWEFENASDLGEATIGNDLTLNNGNSTIVPVTGVTFGDGAAFVGAGDSFSLNHDIAPNGGSTAYVNEFAVVYDINTQFGGVWRSLLQTATTPGGNDGDYFIGSGNNIGVGAINYTSQTVNASTWYRIVFSADIGSDIDGNVGSSFFTTVIDDAGSVVFTHLHAAQGLDGRHSLYSTVNANIVHFFADDAGEDQPILVSQLALYDTFLTQAQAEGLGAPNTFIPEPASLILLGLGSLAMLRRNRH